jgi:rubrerythrin
MNLLQRFIARTYENGEFAHVQTAKDVRACGDGLFRFLMNEAKDLGVDPCAMRNSLVQVQQEAARLEFAVLEAETDKGRFENHYKCKGCNYSWTDFWDCACDDECPMCGVPHSPRDSIDHFGVALAATEKLTK